MKPSVIKLLLSLVKGGPVTSLETLTRSGSGKTVSCNHIVEYITSRGPAGKNRSDLLGDVGVVLDAFGNASTIRNKNSSRYAKVVKVSRAENRQLTPDFL